MNKTVCFLIALGACVPAWAQTYWVSSRGFGGPPHVLFEFDANGQWTFAEPLQIPESDSSAWGYRDGASDGAGHIYFGWEGGVARHDDDGSNGILLFANTTPLTTIRALAFDSSSNTFWTADFASALLQLDATTGAVLQSFPNIDGWSLYGLAYDDSSGNLWGHHGTRPTIIQPEVFMIDITTPGNMGRIVPGSRFFSDYGVPPGGADPWPRNGGLSMNDSTGTLINILQGAPDSFASFDTAGNLTGPFAMNPIDVESQTGNNGQLGIAIVPGGGGGCTGQLCGDTNCDTLFNGGDIDSFFLALGDPIAWAAQFPNCDLLCVADINQDGSVNGGDIDVFFLGLGQGVCPPPGPAPIVPPARLTKDTGPADD
ncbi:MAG: hypothetical protein IH986_10685 [Planctomycetes bacterium]|nr:hypothetical protein [Planctomycetota bacterium]